MDSRADSISLLDLSEALASPTTRRAIEDITSESYANAPVLLQQEYEKNNRTYLHRDEDGNVDAFFMVGWSTVDNIKGQTVFLGLSSASNRVKSKGIGKKLYRTFFESAAEWAQSHGVQVAWWFHTATPVVANVIWNMLPYANPRPDGSFNESDRRTVEIIKEHYGMSSYSCSSHPFVLRRYAKARYAPVEVQRIGTYWTSANEGHLLKRLAIDERKGDRLLVVGRINSQAE